MNVHAQFAALASIASSEPTDLTPRHSGNYDEVTGDPILVSMPGADGKPSAADIATAQTAIDAVLSAYASLNA